MNPQAIIQLEVLQYGWTQDESGQYVDESNWLKSACEDIQAEKQAERQQRLLDRLQDEPAAKVHPQIGAAMAKAEIEHVLPDEFLASLGIGKGKTRPQAGEILRWQLREAELNRDNYSIAIIRNNIKRLYNYWIDYNPYVKAPKFSLYAYMTSDFVK